MDQSAAFINNGKFCKNHWEMPSKYFITDQPWLKYCKDCAFNIALCGKKIQKQLNSQEFDRKMVIASITNDLRKRIQEIEENNLFFGHLTKMLEQVSKPMQERLQQIEAAVRELTQSKHKLQQIYHNEIFERIRQFFEKQSRITLQSMEMKRQLQRMESSFGNLIELDSREQFEKNRQAWSSMLVENKKQIVDEQEYNQLQDQMVQNIQLFYAQFHNITKFKINHALDNKPKLSKISSIEDEFNMTLTPIEATSLNGSAIVDTLKLNLRSKAQLKLRANRKINTDRQTKANSKTATKRSVMFGSENVSIETGSNKKVYR